MSRALKPVVIIGAARSGTKVLRDSLAVAAGVPCVPYDVGYIWQYGHESRSDDCLTRVDATPRTTRLVRRFVARYADPEGRVIEKTVANSMRVPYVAAILPQAVFVHLVRDGADVAESVRRQWTAPPDFRYLAGKARHVPWRVAPAYGRRYLASLARRELSADRRVATWGPRYPGMTTDLTLTDLLTVGARQWRECVTRARQGLAEVDAPSVEVRYETLVREPALELERVARRCGLTPTPATLAAASRAIHSGRSGHGRRRLTDAELARLDVEIGATLHELGYDRLTGQDGARGGEPA